MTAKMKRREFITLVGGAAILAWMLAVSRLARAQAYPVRPVHLIEGFGAGGASDIVARLIGQSPFWVRRRLRARPPISASSSPTRPKNGAR
jgi:hypothetical protein